MEVQMLDGLAGVLAHIGDDTVAVVEALLLSELCDDRKHMAQQLAERVTAVTHNHPDGIRGAAAVASAILLAKTGTPKEEIRRYIDNNYYPVMFTLASIPKDYGFEAACSRSVPQALVAFFESDGFEDAIRNAISIGGDSDTIAAITGSVAEAAYGVPETIRSEVDRRLTPDIRAVFAAFGKKLDSRK